MDKKCYKFKRYNYKNPIFKKSIDATYIIHLENNGRIEHIKNQLSIYHPTNTIYICFNKGYKKCTKQQFIKNPPYDLIDAFIQVFLHAKQTNYNNILILEDDFIFTQDILDKNNIDNINDFLIKNINNKFEYHLGCLPLLLLPYSYNHYKNIFSLGMHSVIYSKELREDVLNIPQNKISDWDFFNNFNFTNNRYCYYKPLCYQLFPKTENSKYWGINCYDKYLKQYLNILSRTTLTILELDKKYEPGFSYFYIFGKINFFILIFIIYYSVRKIEQSMTFK